MLYHVYFITCVSVFSQKLYHVYFITCVSVFSQKLYHVYFITCASVFSHLLVVKTRFLFVLLGKMIGLLEELLYLSASKTLKIINETMTPPTDGGHLTEK